MHLSYKQKRCQAGYTLVELMIAVALTGIVTMSIYKGYISVSTAYDVQDQVVEVQQNARVVLGQMVKEIRMTGFDKNKIGVGGFGTINATEINFTKDMSGNGDINDAGEDITYKLDGEELKRIDNNTGDTDVVVDNISALRFLYYDKTGASTITNSDVRIVQIIVVAKATNEDGGYVDKTDYKYDDLSGNTVTILSAPNDRFRRQILTAVLRCPNMWLKD